MPPIIDAHAHCGVKDRSYAQTFADYAEQVAGTRIGGVVFFSPVMEIYDRHDFNFSDTPAWQKCRQKSNAYLLTLKPLGLTIYPYFFIWNDFSVEQLTPAHCGIKWHRHPGEPVYNYGAPRCTVALNEIRKRNLPVVLEEELNHTKRFIREMAGGIRVVIPHLGALNGGFQAIVASGLWELENVWADTALASPGEIKAYIRRYGYQRLMFGSDFPFGEPAWELEKVKRLGLDPAVEAEVVGGNFLRLQEAIG